MQEQAQIEQCKQVMTDMRQSMRRADAKRFIYSPHHSIQCSSGQRLPQALLQGFCRDHNITTDARTRDEVEQAVVQAAAEQQGLLQALIDYAQRSVIIAAYGIRHRRFTGDVLTYTVILSDRHAAGARYMYKAVAVSTGGLFEHVSTMRTKALGERVEIASLPAEVQTVLETLGYFH